VKKNRIKKKRGLWNFGGNVAPNFVDHILRSVPFYKNGHEIIIKSSDFFLKNGSVCYDIGSSTAELLINLSKFTNKKVKFIGLDSENKMVNFSKKLIKKKKIKNILIKQADILKHKLDKADLIISYYTMQFIEPKFRQFFLNKIYKSLNWGGGFFVFEKIRGNDARFQDILTSLYHEFKENNGFSIKEIDTKAKSLRGVLEPFSDLGNIGLIKRAGFTDIQPVFQYLNFKGYMCIK
jgi:tRNA (cmo5U34)-methyltransferase